MSSNQNEKPAIDQSRRRMYSLNWSIICMMAMAALAWQKRHLPVQTEPAFQYLTIDSVVLDVYEVRDGAGLLEGYRAHVRTPVCEDGRCYEAELDFFWDLLGSFTHYLTDPEKPLTKLDHVVFTPADHEKLNRILSTESPSFIHLRREELVIKPEIDQPDDVDGMTGATVKSVKKDMVEGAIYTCYTLWHIANGGIQFRIQEHTRKKLDGGLIRKMLHEGDAKTHYLLIESMAPRYFGQFLEDILDLADGYDAFFITRLVEQLPKELFSDPKVQHFFQKHFERLEYGVRQSLITKLENAKPDRQLKKLIKRLKKI